MARGFGSTDGAGTTDAITTVHAPGTVFATSCWLWLTGAGGGGQGRIFNGGSVFIYDDVANTLRFTALHSTTSGVWSVPAPATGGWHHVLFAYNGGSVSNDPFVWIDGVSQTVTELTTPVGTFTAPTALILGNRGAGDRVLNGRLAEYALYEGGNVQRAIDHVSGLAAGMSPAFIPGWTFYYPLVRANVNRTGVAPTITGTVVHPHPRQFYPRLKNFWPAVGTPIATRGRVSWAELETPFAPTRGRVSFAELEVPNVATRGRVSHVELEVPTVQTRGRVSFAELEVPSEAVDPTRGRVSWAELEVPTVQTRGRIAWVELEVPNVATRGRVSWAELEVPVGATRGRVSWSELEVPSVATRGRISWAEFQVPDVGGGGGDYVPPRYRRRRK